VHYAAMTNDTVYLTVLLAHRADPSTRHGATGATPVVPALMANRDTNFRRLLAAGADPNAADRMGDTRLHVAAKINAFDRVLDLLEAWADPHATNKRGITFQTYLDRTPKDILTDEARRQRAHRRVAAGPRFLPVPLSVQPSQTAGPPPASWKLTRREGPGGACM
jgi:uncharacterized protein